MASEKINGFHGRPIQVTASGQVYAVGRNATVIAPGQYANFKELGAIYEDRDVTPDIHDNVFNVDGRLVGYRYGLQTFGANDRINVGAEGEISGFYAIYGEGQHTVVTNHGDLLSPLGTGIFESGAGSSVRNWGTITGLRGIVTYSTGDEVVVNEANGRIFAGGSGVILVSLTTRFVNHGLVISREEAVFGGDGRETVINDGIMKGAVILGAGNDIVDTRGGSIHGEISGGGGDDILITDRARYKLVETVDGGSDRIRSTVSYTLSDNVETLILIGKGDANGAGTSGKDTLIGNDGDNTLIGNHGADTLAGGKGNDTLIGRDPSSIVLTDGSDVFVFSTGDGHDRVVDYVKFDDTIDFSGWEGIDSFADVASHAHENGDGLSIRLGHDSLLMVGFNKTDLGEDGLFFKF